MQTTIDSLFNRNTFIKPYFILNWNKKLEPEVAYFSDEKPTTYTYKHSVLIKSLHKSITIYGNLSKFPEKKIHKTPKYNNIELLKSQLQKAIRRQNEKVAVLTARHLLDIDTVTFLRRISIITIEDVELNNQFPIIIWLMIACSSGFLMDTYQKEWLLGYVYAITHHNTTDRIFNNLNLTDYKVKDILEKVGSPMHYDIITCLEIRRQYGGMNCDMEMFRKLIWYWGMKSRSLQPVPIISIPPILYNTDDLEKKEWILESIDYHCFPKIIEWLKNKEEVGDGIKNEIWRYRSSVNKRVKNEVMPVEWKSINKELNKIAYYVISKFS